MKIVTLETALLAKEKGFNYMYSLPRACYVVKSIDQFGNIGDIIPFCISDEFNIAALHQYELMDWLRGVR